VASTFEIHIHFKHLDLELELKSLCLEGLSKKCYRHIEFTTHKKILATCFKSQIGNRMERLKRGEEEIIQLIASPEYFLCVCERESVCMFCYAFV
jgi:hypothetical protein